MGVGHSQHGGQGEEGELHGGEGGGVERKGGEK